jgi:hypothetical protein
MTSCNVDARIKFLDRVKGRSERINEELQELEELQDECHENGQMVYDRGG